MRQMFFWLRGHQYGNILRIEKSILRKKNNTLPSQNLKESPTEVKVPFYSFTNVGTVQITQAKPFITAETESEQSRTNVRQ